jgi:hypothetical protein
MHLPSLPFILASLSLIYLLLPVLHYYLSVLLSASAFLFLCFFSFVSISCLILSAFVISHCLPFFHFAISIYSICLSTCLAPVPKFVITLFNFNPFLKFHMDHKLINLLLITMFICPGIMPTHWVSILCSVF